MSTADDEGEGFLSIILESTLYVLLITIIECNTNCY
jgi:hypothetical protein